MKPSDSPTSEDLRHAPTPFALADSPDLRKLDKAQTRAPRPDAAKPLAPMTSGEGIDLASPPSVIAPGLQQPTPARMYTTKPHVGPIANGGVTVYTNHGSKSVWETKLDEVFVICDQSMVDSKSLHEQ